MLRTHQRLFHRGIKSLDLSIVAAAVFLSGSASSYVVVLQQAAVLSVAWVIVSLRTNFYQSRRTDSLRGELIDLIETWLVTFALGCLAIHLIWGSFAFGLVVTFGAVIGGIFTVRASIRLALRRLRDQGKNYRRVILVGRGRASHAIVENTKTKPWYGLRMVGSFHLPGEKGLPPEGVENLGDTARFAKIIPDLEVDSVVLCPDTRARPEDTQYILDKCDVAGINCFYAPDFLHLNNLRATSTTIGDMPAFTFQPALGSPFQLAIKRGMDIGGSLLGIILCLPVLVAVAIAVKSYDGGPLLFRQIRLGKDGRRFYCYKFRSMCVDAEAKRAALEDLNEQDGPVFKVKEDPRITPVGRLIRKYSLDELPQLFNVLLGDMSLVGPRPPVPSEVARYSWWQRRRISVRPGLTCLWQVKGRNRVSFEKWMEMDLFYIDNWSLWMDIKLMMQTMPVVVRGTGS